MTQPSKQQIYKIFTIIPLIQYVFVFMLDRSTVR